MFVIGNLINNNTSVTKYSDFFFALYTFNFLQTQINPPKALHITCFYEKSKNIWTDNWSLQTAEMSGFCTEGEYDLSGFAVGIVKKIKSLMEKKNIVHGDVLIKPSRFMNYLYFYLFVLLGIICILLVMAENP